MLDSERSSLPGAPAVGLNVELFYFFEIREKNGCELFKKKSLGYFIDSERLIVLRQTCGTGGTRPWPAACFMESTVFRNNYEITKIPLNGSRCNRRAYPQRKSRPPISRGRSIHRRW